MTTEVAILNREAIALAADSAVTINNGTKIYNSANKLFALSKNHPIGMMVYGNAQLTGVPWETLIKMYRKQLGDTIFPKLIDYCEDFINFLAGNSNFFLEEDQSRSVEAIVIDNFENIKEEIVYAIEDTFEKQDKVSKTEAKKIVDDAIEENCQKLESRKYISGFEKSFISSIPKKYNSTFEEIIDFVFDELSISNKSRNKLLKIAANSLLRDNFSSHQSGIVIAGFGDKEVFPSLHTYNIDCVFENRLKYIKNQDKSHEIGTYPVIIPFAQEDMISTFVEGIDPRIQKLSIYALSQTLKTYFESVSQSVISELTKGINSEEINNAINKINKDFDETRRVLLDNYNEEMIRQTRRIHIEPILDTVSILPKDELGAMAEALVNLTSLKRRVTTDKETVGGPTDVALISKGDGFIWIKRKHYFDPDLNPDFFANKLGFNSKNYIKKNDNG